MKSSAREDGGPMRFAVPLTLLAKGPAGDQKRVRMTAEEILNQKEWRRSPEQETDLFPFGNQPPAAPPAR